MGANAELVRLMGPELDVLLPMLDEKSRRLVLGAVARAAGDGGITAVADAAGASWQTVANGAAELESGDAAPAGRVRRPGGGRKRLEEHDPWLTAALRELVEASTRGDPESLLVWTTLSVRDIAAELTRRGHPCGKGAVLRLLHAGGFSTQGNSRTVEGRRHPDRDGQFRHIARRAGEFLAAGDPVISVDTKKKELAGLYARKGREWRPKGDPRQVRDHDFPDPGGGTAIPYGVYDVGDNTGFVNVGTDHDTPAFAVESVRRWWDTLGKTRYPGARRLLITADAGGSNSYRARAWPAELARFAAETGLEITVSHFPPGTSKWNKIEHRLFCHISRTWRARPLASHQVIIDTIAATSTAAGLTVTARLDIGRYPLGAEVSDTRMKELQDRLISRDDFHGAWNYTVLPVPRPAPGPEPGAAAPARAGRCGQDTLNHPALTGMDPADLNALAAALQIPYRARREQDLYTRRRRGRVRAEGAAPPRKIDLTDHVLATRIRRHLNLPVHVIAALLGADRTTISHAVSLTGKLLHSVPQPPAAASPGIRLRTLDDLRGYAAGHGITITGPAAEAGAPPQDTLTTPGTPQTHLK